MKIKPIGGEFWFDNNIMSQKTNIINGYFLNGGRSSLSCICKYLKSIEGQKIMIPAYLCPTILDVFDKEQIDYIFYDVNEDFSINIDSISDNINSVESVMFINYFGLSLSQREIDYLTSLKKANKLLIEDKVNTIYSHYFGDFAFNSFRKFMPLSGSVLQTDIDMETIISGLEYNLPYERQINKARKLKTEFIMNDVGYESNYLHSFETAENLYYKAFSRGSVRERALVEKIDFMKLAHIRNQNYKYLQNILSDITDIKIIFDEIGNKTPLGLPVYIDEDKRDYLVNKLKCVQIYLPIHWDLRNENRICSEKIKTMSNRILTLVVDQRYDKTDMDRIGREIRKNIG